MITSAKLDRYREDLNAVIADWAKKNGLKIGTINFKYSANEFRAAIQFNEINEDGSFKIDPDVVRQLTDLMAGTSLEGQNPFGHTFKTERGTEAKLIGYHPYRKYGYEIEEFSKKKGKMENLLCNLRYLNSLKEPVR